MTRRNITHSRLLSVIGALGIALAGFMPGSAIAAANPSGPTATSGATHQPVCPGPTTAGTARCFSRVRTDPSAKASSPRTKASAGQPAGSLGNGGAYDPPYLQSAYNLGGVTTAGGWTYIAGTPSASSGGGQTVAIVDAYDDPNAANDLAFYRSSFGLSPADGASGHPWFRKVDQAGGTNYPRGNYSWGLEISLDLDMVSAICPNCNILLVEANSNGFSDLAAAVDYAAAHANAVSNSYGANEFSGETSYDSHYNHPGVAMTVSSGDNGYGVEWPAASPYVTAVGGTSLTQNTNTGTRDGSESVWSGAGSGCSAYETKPNWQGQTLCGNRMVTDTSGVADPNTGVWVYDTYVYSGWQIVGGTSASSPITAAVYALAGGAQANTYPASYPYGHVSNLNDVTSGSNGTCSVALWCTGEPGDDGPTGLGTPNGDAAFAPAPASPPVVSSISPTHGISGTSIIISGSNFTGASAVNFGSAIATFSINTAGTQITATVPTQAAGTVVDVTVTTSAGTSTTSSADQFTYDAPPPAPVVSSVSPTHAAAGTAITISGSNLNGATSVNFGSAKAASFTVDSTGSTISTTAPSQPSATTVDVTVTTAGGTSVLSNTDGFSYDPVVTGVSPKSGPAGTSVTISGSNLGGATTVAFGSVNAAIGSVSGTQVVATAPAQPDGTTVDLVVTTPIASSAKSNADQFTYSTPPPTPTFQLSPATSSLTVKRNSTASETFTLTASGSYASAVTMSISGLPAKASGSFSPNPATPTSAGATTALTIRANPNTPTGTSSLNVTAKGSDGTVQTATVTLTVQ